MKYNSVEYKRLSYFKNYPEEITKESGVYYWVYYPEISENQSLNYIKSKLLEFSKKRLLFSEDLKGTYKYEATIYEQWYPDNGKLFGLAPRKEIKLLKFLEDQDNINLFNRFFVEVCFSRPFYIGKANNLRSRLSNYHFKAKTEIIPQIQENNISETEIWVGYKIIKDDLKMDLNNIFEEIFSRRIKPGLTKKPN